jgi:hypothetical protein
MFGAFALADEEPGLYVEAVEEAQERLATDASEGYLAFRDEFAVHIRESSFPPASEADSQWMTDEWLRDVWYDAFGPEPPPGDPYPVPADHWGRLRQTDYMIYAVKETPERSSPGAAAWLERRGLTFAEVREGVLRSPAKSLNFRPAPEGWLDHLRELTARGLRETQPGE